MFRSTPLQAICAYYTVNYLAHFHAVWMVCYPATKFFWIPDCSHDCFYRQLHKLWNDSSSATQCSRIL